MNLKDEEILIEYQIYKIRRNRKILIITIPLLVFVIIFMLLFSSLFLSEKKQNNKPILKLNKNSITVKVNKEIDYMSFVKSANDQEDGELSERIKYNKIDISKSGVYQIVYSIIDNDNNKANSILTVTVEPLTEVVEKEVVPVEQPNATVEVQPPNIIPTPPPATTKPNPAPVVNKPPNKDFLFSDGTTNMGNAISVCEAYIGSFSGDCSELRDANGLVIGSRATFK